ncbi:MAG: DUF1365 domain-containing protein [Cyclobacteriaceae bacterium]|nr:DUF1365 domain-containing protein [Cyclobacteriaceae bacterium]
MNSCLYRCEVMHHRLVPREHKFRYNVFMFYIDLDEVEQLHKKLRFLSCGRSNWFNFRNQDHLQFPLGKGHNQKSVKQNVLDYLKSQGVTVEGRVMLLTNVSTLGYSFNPISFYLCFDTDNNPVCSVAEVCNTHGEMKLYLLDKDCYDGTAFGKLVTKNFYVSPFTDLDAAFHFIFKVPGETALMRVDDYQEGKRFLLTSLSGKKKPLNDWNLLFYGIRFPFITMGIMFSIYWQALRLKLKKIPFRDKDFNIHLQQDKYQYKKV